MNALNSLLDNVVSLWVACNAEAHTLGGILSVLSVGIGLYLGLAVVQVVGAGRIATLRRRVSSVRNLVNKNKLTNCNTLAGNLESKLLTIEIGLENLSSILFAISLMLLSVCLGAIFYSTVFQSHPIDCFTVVAIGAYCLLLPLVIFLISSAIIRLKTKGIVSDVKEANTAVRLALSNRHK